jgi:branched-chain amino acid transport system substrate-binding protein
VPEFTKLTGKNSEGVIYDLLGGTIANEKNPRGLEVTSKFKQKYGTGVGTYGVVLYETINLYFDALRKVKDPANHQAIAEAIGASDKDVAEGHLNFDPMTHLAMQGDNNFPIQFYQIQGGNRVLISPEKYATGSFRTPAWTK